MARSDPQFNLRIPTDLKERLEASAKSSGRSVTAEILANLESALSGETLTREDVESARLEFARGFASAAIQSLVLSIQMELSGEFDHKIETRVLDVVEDQADDVVRKITREKPASKHAESSPKPAVKRVPRSKPAASTKR